MPAPVKSTTREPRMLFLKIDLLVTGAEDARETISFPLHRCFLARFKKERQDSGCALA
jgi:hypothetical protein